MATLSGLRKCFAEMGEPTRWITISEIVHNLSFYGRVASRTLLLNKRHMGGIAGFRKHEQKLSFWSVLI